MPLSYTERSLEKIASIMDAYEPPSTSEMNHVLKLIRNDKWGKVLEAVRSNPYIAVAPLVMDNHITTTIMHKALTGRADVAARAQLVEFIIDTTPAAAAIKNGYGSLPLHVVCQRNTKIKAKIKVRLILKLCKAYPGGLEECGGIGQRTPLHIVFTDYVSPKVTEYMLSHGKRAAFMTDRKGFLPAHVACLRHCSPKKLQMLLDINPDALHAKTLNGDTLLSLASSNATKSHPNYTLIEEIKKQLNRHGSNIHEPKPTAMHHHREPVGNHFYYDVAEPSSRTTPPLASSESEIDGGNVSFVGYPRSWESVEGSTQGPPTKRFKYDYSVEPAIENPGELLLNFAQSSTTNTFNADNAARVSLDDGASYQGENHSSVAV